MDWNNVDLNSIEVYANIIDPYSFDDLLLEIHCNIPIITKEAVIKQFEESLQININTAREIFLNNVDRICKKAIADKK